MAKRSLILALVAALFICVVPAQAAKKKAMKTMSEEQMIGATYAKGVELANHRHWNAAIEAMTKVIDNPKTSKDIMANALENRGLSYSNKKMTEEALADLNKALEIKPDLESALYHRARILAMQNKHDAAIQDLTKAIAVSQPSPIQANLYFNRAISYMAVNKDAEGKADFAQAKKLNPKLKIPTKYKGM